MQSLGNSYIFIDRYKKKELYHRGVAFLKKMRVNKRLKKLNIRDHKRRLLTAKYELRRKFYKSFCKDPDLPSDMWDKHRYNHPCSVYEFFRISPLQLVYKQGK
ncbi:unnamed protein product, partial [Vitis vinifera]